VEQHETSVRATRYQSVAAREAKEKLNCDKLCDNGERLEVNWIIRSKEAGAWVTVIPSTKNDTMLAREEWSDNCRYRYGFEPTNLPEYCDGCGEQFTTEHDLNCKKGGLVDERHADAADEWALTWPPWHGNQGWYPTNP